MEVDVQRAENEWKNNHKLTPELTDIITGILLRGDPYENVVDALPKCWEFTKARSGQTLCHMFFTVSVEPSRRRESMQILSMIRNDISSA